MFSNNHSQPHECVRCLDSLGLASKTFMDFVGNADCASCSVCDPEGDLPVQMLSVMRRVMLAVTHVRSATTNEYRHPTSPSGDSDLAPTVTQGGVGRPGALKLRLPQCARAAHRGTDSL